MRRLAAVLFLIFTASAHAQWLALDDAVARAQAAHKPLIVYLRGACGDCNRKSDAFVDAAETHDIIVRSYAPFIRARAGTGDSGAAASKLLLQKPPAPAILVLEPGGTFVVAWKDWSSLNRYMNFLRLLRDQADEIAAASIAREKSAGEADLILGNAALYVQMVDRARELFRRSRDDFDQRGNRERAEAARIGVDFADFFASRSPSSSAASPPVIVAEVPGKPPSAVGRGNPNSASDRNSAREDLQRLIHESTSPSNQANGYLSLATMEMVEDNIAGEIRALRGALAIAPPGSSESKDARAELERLGDLQPDVKQETLIRIVAPPRATITGRAKFSAAAAPSVKRVAWFVDGVAVASSEQAPFEERLDLGATPRLHTINAVGFNASGGAVAQAVATINDRLDFRVALVSPVGSEISGRTVVEASVEAPPDRTTKSVELFWNEVKIGGFEVPPYRVTFNTPNAFGYFRAVATLDDGRTAEETRVVNSPAVGETLDVHAIAFAATVTDKNGERIGGLTANDFKVTDRGEAVKVKVRDADDEPVTIGLAIDSSASMRSVLLDTMETAFKFVNVAVSPRDRVFLVAFDDRPHLLESPTTDRDALKNAIFDLRPAGTTALIDAIAFSLQQFTGLPGKKALVVVTDAIEASSTQTSTAATRMAKESGVPLYLVLPPGARMSQFGNPFVGIVNASGGMIVNPPKPENEEAIFTRIRDEVRGQYLLSFPSHASPAGAWRDLRVEVARPHAVVRTIAGYYAR